jgi:hypothetical protein
VWPPDAHADTLRIVTQRRTVSDVSAAQRLRDLDDRVFPDRTRGRYDSPRPWWFFYASILAMALVFVAIWAPDIVGGARGVVIRVFAVLGWLALLMVTVAWDRTHRSRPEDGAYQSTQGWVTARYVRRNRGDLHPGDRVAVDAPLLRGQQGTLLRRARLANGRPAWLIRMDDPRGLWHGRTRVGERVLVKLTNDR